MNKKVILTTAAVLATMATAKGVYADETNVQGTTGTGNEASTVTAPSAGATGTEKNETTQVDKQPTAENTNAEAGSESNDSNKQGNATQFVKNGSDI